MPDSPPPFRGRRPAVLRFGTSGLRGLATDITDLEAYPGFMPNTDRLRILERRGDTLTTEHRLKLKFGVISTKIDYVLTHELDPEKLTMDFRHKSGALSSVRGGWRVRASRRSPWSSGYRAPAPVRPWRPGVVCSRV